MVSVIVYVCSIRNFNRYYDKKQFCFKFSNYTKTQFNGLYLFFHLCSITAKLTVAVQRQVKKADVFFSSNLTIVFPCPPYALVFVFVQSYCFGTEIFSHDGSNRIRIYEFSGTSISGN